MPSKTFYERHDEIKKEVHNAWEWLRKISEYHKDYKCLKGKQPYSDEDTKYCKKRWGFSPLDNPKDYLSWGLLTRATTKLGYEPFNWGVDFKNLSLLEMQAYNKKTHKFECRQRLPPLPPEIIIGVNPYKPIEKILHHIKRSLNLIKEAYRIKPRVRPINFELDYKVYALRGLGLKLAFRTF